MTTHFLSGHSRQISASSGLDGFALRFCFLTATSEIELDRFGKQCPQEYT
jgi:hypothetical protein